MWWYVSSIIIYYCILRASIQVCGAFLEERNRLEKIKKMPKLKRDVSLLCVCCIPIVRFIVFIMLYYLCFCSDEHFNKITKIN